MTIDAVLWDFGGVITASPFDAFARYEREHGLPVRFLRSVNAHNPLDNAWARLERSACTAAEFDALFAAESAALGHEVPGADVLALIDGVVRPEMVQALRRLHGRVKLGCITNNFLRSDPRAPTVTDKGEILALFDHVIESAKAGVRKPDPRIYRMMTDALEVDPSRCVYLDDLGINLKPARAMGMHTIKVASAEQALVELEAVLGFPLRD